MAAGSVACWRRATTWAMRPQMPTETSHQVPLRQFHTRRSGQRRVCSQWRCNLLRDSHPSSHRAPGHSSMRCPSFSSRCLGGSGETRAGTTPRQFCVLARARQFGELLCRVGGSLAPSQREYKVACRTWHTSGDASPAWPHPVPPGAASCPGPSSGSGLLLSPSHAAGVEMIPSVFSRRLLFC